VANKLTKKCHQKNQIINMNRFILALFCTILLQFLNSVSFTHYSDIDFQPNLQPKIKPCAATIFAPLRWRSKQQDEDILDHYDESNISYQISDYHSHTAATEHRSDELRNRIESKTEFVMFSTHIQLFDHSQNEFHVAIPISIFNLKQNHQPTEEYKTKLYKQLDEKQLQSIIQQIKTLHINHNKRLDELKQLQLHVNNQHQDENHRKNTVKRLHAIATNKLQSIDKRIEFENQNYEKKFKSLIERLKSMFLHAANELLQENQDYLQARQAIQSVSNPIHVSKSTIQMHLHLPESDASKSISMDKKQFPSHHLALMKFSVGIFQIQFIVPAIDFEPDKQSKRTPIFYDRWYKSIAGTINCI
jgi:hypothetical protein